MATKETLLKDLDWITEKISSQVWTLNLGTLGTTWSLLVTSSVPEQFRLTVNDSRWIFLLCLAALLCEMGQYLSAYVITAAFSPTWRQDARQNLISSRALRHTSDARPSSI
jgi:hypothetical protein